MAIAKRSVGIANLTFWQHIHHSCSEFYISHTVQFLDFPLQLLPMLLHYRFARCRYRI
jgi:hypothetical protein